MESYLPDQKLSEEKKAQLKPIWDYLYEKPHKYGHIIDRSFSFDNDEGKLGYAFSLGFMFNRGRSPVQLLTDLKVYQIVKEESIKQKIDLVSKIDNEDRVIPYNDTLPLNTLAIGYLTKLPSTEEIDVVFQTYDNIESRLKTFASPEKY